MTFSAIATFGLFVTAIFLQQLVEKRNAISLRQLPPYWCSVLFCFRFRFRMKFVRPFNFAARTVMLRSADDVIDAYRKLQLLVIIWYRLPSFGYG